MALGAAPAPTLHCLATAAVLPEEPGSALPGFGSSPPNTPHLALSQHPPPSPGYVLVT